MCISASVLATMASLGTAAATIYGIDQQQKAGYQARLAADTAQSKADAAATQTANARLAQRRRALSANSLVTDQTSSSMASSGRSTLGGG